MAELARNQHQVLSEWYDRVATSQRAQYRAALYFGRLHFWLGIPVIVLTTIVGTSVFASLSKQPNLNIQITIGLASVLAAVLASLQTFLGLGDRAEKHRLAGAKYGAVGRHLEELLAGNPDDAQISRVRERLDTLALESPNVPLKIYQQARGLPQNVK